MWRFLLVLFSFLPASSLSRSLVHYVFKTSWIWSPFSTSIITTPVPSTVFAYMTHCNSLQSSYFYYCPHKKYFLSAQIDLFKLKQFKCVCVIVTLLKSFCWLSVELQIKFKLDIDLSGSYTVQLLLIFLTVLIALLSSIWLPIRLIPISRPFFFFTKMLFP